MFSSLDMREGFTNVPIGNKADREKTAFSTPFGHYEYNFLPFGLKNATAIFSQFMAHVLGNLRFEARHLLNKNGHGLRHRLPLIASRPPAGH